MNKKELMPRRTNVFLIINLGCEMMYVIDQRLKAQCITLEKSSQVLRDITCVLFDPKLLDQFMVIDKFDGDDRNLLTPQQCRILLSDIACCSLMRLDNGSMDKLWDLMVMVFKWQLSIAGRNPQRLLDITFRHMDGIGRLLPEMRKTILIDCTKRHLIEYWDLMEEINREEILASLLEWTRSYNVKISILIRLGFQKHDGKFVTNLTSEFYQYYADHIGENIYTKNAYMTSAMLKSSTIKCVGNNSSSGDAASVNSISGTSSTNITTTDCGSLNGQQPQTHEIESLSEQLNICRISNDTISNTISEFVSSSSGGGGSCRTNSNGTTCGEEEEEDINGKNNQTEYIEIEQRKRVSQFENIPTASQLDIILERFSLDFYDPVGDPGIVEEFDATRELLKMLDED